jgi:hypothetical protein
MMNQDSLNYWLVVIVAYLYFDSWVTTFKLRAILKKIEKMEEY